MRVAMMAFCCVSGEFDVVVQIEAPDHCVIDGHEPCEACRTVEDASQRTLLASHTGQLAVGTVEDVGNHQQHDGDDVEHKPGPAAIVVAGTAEEHGTACSDEHRSDGDGVGMDVQLSEKDSQIVAQRADDVQIKPVLGLGGFQRCCVFLVHIFFVYSLQFTVYS